MLAVLVFASVRITMLGEGKAVFQRVVQGVGAEVVVNQLQLVAVQVAKFAVDPVVHLAQLEPHLMRINQRVISVQPDPTQVAQEAHLVLNVLRITSKMKQERLNVNHVKKEAVNLRKDKPLV